MERSRVSEKEREREREDVALGVYLSLVALLAIRPLRGASISPPLSPPPFHLSLSSSFLFSFPAFHVGYTVWSRAGRLDGDAHAPAATHRRHQASPLDTHAGLSRSFACSLARSLVRLLARSRSLSRSFSLSRALSLALSLSRERARALSSFSLSPLSPQPHPACALTAGALWHGGVRVCSRCTSGRCTAGRTWTS